MKLAFHVSRISRISAAATLNKIPGWLLIGLSMAGGVAWQTLSSNTNLTTDIQHWSTLWPDLRTALIMGGITLLGYLKQDPWTPKTSIGGSNVSSGPTSPTGPSSPINPISPSGPSGQS